MTPGTRIGPYEITSKLGEGGMGEVYRARDSKLARDVAIKILPDAFAADPDRLARFRREAQALAALNHQHIAGIYGLEEGPPPFIVMELVDGQTLAHRIAKGPIPFEEALPIARQIAEALEAAHDRGIVHRDLKPANIKIRDDGSVKVLDFGLAKTIDDDDSRRGRLQSDLSQSPTITSPAMTHAGMILGTAAYMSPEQAKGRPVDQRADVWAFGAVLYEMLTARRLFDPSAGSGSPRASSRGEGDDVSETLASILKGTIDWGALPPWLPSAITRLLHRCLERDVRLRLSDMAMVQLELRDAEREAASPPAMSTAATPRAQSRAVAAIAAAAIAAVISGAIVWQVRRPVEPRTLPARFSIQLSNGVQLTPGGRNPLAISPDGTRLVYAENQRLYLRALDQIEATVIPGTELGGPSGHARVPFFSADGKSIGFWQQGQLRKIEIAGGSALALCDSPLVPTGAFWGPDDRIVWTQVASDAGPTTILEVSAAGGTAQPLATFDTRDRVTAPQGLPGNEWILFVLHPAGAPGGQGKVMLLSRKTKEQRMLTEGVTTASYLPPEYLVLGRGNALRVQRLDLSGLTVIGAPVPVADDVDQVPGAGFMVLAVSSSGTLFYRPTAVGSEKTETQLMTVMRNGEAAKIADVAGLAWFPRFSPDGTRVAFGISSSTVLNDDADLWVLDLARGARTRVTFKANNRFYPIWTRDGTRLTFSDGTFDNNRVLSAPADGSGTIETLLDTGPRRYGTSWSPDGKVLALYQGGGNVEATGGKSRDLWIMSREDGKWTTTPFVQTPFEERGAIFSPSGKWVAYVSNKSGQNDIYARPYPGPGSEVTISVGGGQEPVWAPSGQELFYRHDSKLFAVKVAETNASLAVSAPVKVFDDRYRLDTGGAGGGVANYDVSPDGKRFVVVQEQRPEGGATAPGRLNVVINWTEELKRRLSAR